MLFTAIVDEGYKTWQCERKTSKPEFENKDITCHCAGNDIACAQILLFNDDPMTLSLNDDPAFYEGGFEEVIRIKAESDVFGADDISFFMTGLMEDDDRNLRSDPLWHRRYFHADGKHTQAVFITVAIPRDAPAGYHKILIKIYSHDSFDDEILLQTLSFTIKVYAWVLPDPSEWEFHLDLWQHNSNIARKHEVKLWSDEHFAIIEEYVSTLAALGQKAITVIASQIPWNGQFSYMMQSNVSDLFEYSCIGITLETDGKWSFDFSALDKLLDIYFRNGIEREVEVFGLAGLWTCPDDGFGSLIEGYEEAIKLRYFNVSKGVYGYIREQDGLRRYLQALEKYFIEKGIIGKVRIVADEPSDIERFTKVLGFIHSAAPSFKFKAAINHIEFIEANIEGLTDYVPVLPYACTEIDRLKILKEERPGSRFCTYVCCWPDYPNTFLRSPLIESRNISWLVSYLGLDGLLRWNYTVWPNDPRSSIIYRAWPAGDTNFVYPGNDGKPVLSQRYFCLRRGIRDFELMRIAADRTEGKEMLAQVYKKVFKFGNAGDLYKTGSKPEELYSFNYSDYENAAASILEYLEKRK